MTSPEQLEPDVDVTKWSASALYTQAIGEGALSLTGAFARKDNSENVTLDAWLGEAAWKLNPDWTIFSRVEAIETDELGLIHHGPVVVGVAVRCLDRLEERQERCRHVGHTAEVPTELTDQQLVPEFNAHGAW